MYCGEGNDGAQQKLTALRSQTDKSSECGVVIIEIVPTRQCAQIVLELTSDFLGLHGVPGILEASNQWLRVF